MGLGIKGVPAKVKGVVTEVTNKLSSGNVLHDTDLEAANEEDQLQKSSGRKARDGSESVGNVGERVSGKVNVSREADSGLLDEVSNDGKHGDAPVLDLGVTKTLKGLGVSVGDNSERIVESERSLGTKLVLKGLEGGGGGGLLGGGESGGGGEEGGEDGELHLDSVFLVCLGVDYLFGTSIVNMKKGDHTPRDKTERIQQSIDLDSSQ